MRLPCWNFTGGAFAVFGCFGRLKCCGLTGLPCANFPFAAFWPETVAVFACSACLLPSLGQRSLLWLLAFHSPLWLLVSQLGFGSSWLSEFDKQRWKSEPPSLFVRDRLPLTFGSSYLSGRDTLPLRFDPFWAFALPTVPSSFSWRLSSTSCRMRRWLSRMLGRLRLLFRLRFLFFFLRTDCDADERKTTN